MLYADDPGFVGFDTCRRKTGSQASTGEGASSLSLKTADSTTPCKRSTGHRGQGCSRISNPRLGEQRGFLPKCPQRGMLHHYVVLRSTTIPKQPTPRQLQGIIKRARQAPVSGNRVGTTRMLEESVVQRAAGLQRAFLQKWPLPLSEGRARRFFGNGAFCLSALFPFGGACAKSTANHRGRSRGRGHPHQSLRQALPPIRCEMPRGSGHRNQALATEQRLQEHSGDRGC